MISSHDTLKSSVIYEAFPRCHGQTGTFKDVIADTERIHSLGVDILWIMPHYPIGKKGRKGSIGCPYAIRDYRAIDPNLGSVADFEELISATHEVGLKLMIDVVFNHTSRDSVLLRDHPEWFYRDHEGELATKVSDWSDVFDLDYRHQDLWKKQIDTLAYWLEMGVDGFRCDVAPLVPLSFWAQVDQELSAIRKPIWLAESVYPSFVRLLRRSGHICHSDPELHSVFDLTYDYDGFSQLDLVLNRKLDLHHFIHHLDLQEALYPQRALKLRFLENHDQLRIASRISNHNRLLHWTLFYLMLPGTALVYAGQEFAATIQPSLFESAYPFNRNNSDFNESFHEMLQLTKRIKKTAHVDRIFQFLEYWVQMDWKDDDITYRAVLCISDDAESLKLHPASHRINLLTGKDISGKKIGPESGPMLFKIDS